MTEYIRQGSVDPNVIQLDLSQKGQEVLKSRTTVTRTETTIQETFEPTERVEDRRKWLRQFVRTDRGNAIITMVPAALESNIQGHLAALRDPKTPRKEQVVHKIWLQYQLAWRWDDIPSGLRREMEVCRDLPLLRRRQKQP